MLSKTSNKSFIALPADAQLWEMLQVRLSLTLVQPGAILIFLVLANKSPCKSFLSPTNLTEDWMFPKITCLYSLLSLFLIAKLQTSYTIHCHKAESQIR